MMKLFDRNLRHSILKSERYRPLPASEFVRLPRHVAIIMDGNGRWAKKHRLSIARGHRQGTEALREIIRHTSDLGIEVLSVYAFSTENWSRSEEEVNALMQLMLEFFNSEIAELEAKNVRIRILGDKARLPQAQREVLREAEERTCKNTGLQLNIAINYGSRDELTMAVRELAVLVAAGEIAPQDITAQTLSGYLYTRGQPDVDLLIRTSGEMRLSNFLLWQSAYAEFLFPQTLWPDFSVKCYDEALRAFGSRDRRFGGRKQTGAAAEGSPYLKKLIRRRCPPESRSDRKGGDD